MGAQLDRNGFSFERIHALFIAEKYQVKKILKSNENEFSSCRKGKSNSIAKYEKSFEIIGKTRLEVKEI